MNFGELHQVETAQTYLEKAFAATRKKAIRAPRGEPHVRAGIIERERLAAFGKSLAETLRAIPRNFPSVDAMSEFYTQLAQATLDVMTLKHALAAVDGAPAIIGRLSAEYQRKIRYTNRVQDVQAVRAQAYGRITSVVKGLKDQLLYLERCRLVMREFPVIKDGLFTVALAGFPNVGKSTLLSRLTTARPDIQPYAFTTKTLNTGYFTHRHQKIQVIDTPGTLDRPEKMNTVEKQAYLAMRYAADLIVYVYDPTESYPWKDQEQLERNIREFGSETLLYASKTDLIAPKELERMEALGMLTDPEELRARIVLAFAQRRSADRTA